MSEQSRPVASDITAGNNNEELLAGVLAKLVDTNSVGVKQKTFAKGEKTDTINLISLFWRLLSKWMFIAGAAILSVALAFVYLLYFHTPVYSATAKLYIINGDDSVINLSSLQIGSQLSADYTEVFKTWEVNQMVREELGVNSSYSSLQSSIKVSNSSSSRVIYITATHTDPQMAADIANAYSKAARTFISSVMKTAEPSSFSTALVPTTPSGTSKAKILILFFLLGTFISAGIIVIQFMLDDHPKTPDDITSVSTLSVLGVVPVYDGDNRKASGGSNESRRN